MKKDAIIDLLENDLREIETLVETFREPERIGSAFLDLLRQKHDSLGKEIRLLDYWATDNMCQTGSSTLTGEVRTQSAEPKMERAMEIEKPADVESKNMPQAKPEAPKKREDVEDYFAEELAAMDDPLAEIAAPREPEKAIEIVFENPLKSDTADAPAQPAKEQPKAQTAAMAEQHEPEPAAKPTPAPKQASGQGGATSKGQDIAVYGTPVDDINKAMGINDRFLYMRELFGGNKMAFDAAIETVNAASSYNQAYEYFRQTYGWDEGDATVEAFLKAVHRRFL